MAEELSVQQLHDRATRGEALTDAERARLEARYEQQDAEEDARINSSVSATPATLQRLRDEVDAALTQVSSAARRAQALAEENEALRRDIADLHQRLARASSPQAA